MKKIYIVSPCRTAIGNFMGSLKDIPAYKLGELVIKEVLNRTNLPSQKVDQVILGNVLQAGQGQNPARQAAVLAGIPVEKPAFTVNKVCGSGLTAISLAASIIRSNDAECIVAGGMENMSQAPYYMKDVRNGKKMGDSTLVDGMVLDGLWDAFNDYHMGITAENIASQYNISRGEQDVYAESSQNKAFAAQTSGKFDDEIIDVQRTDKRGNITVFNEDEYIKPDVDIEKIKKLRPAFTKEGTVTAANSSGINDGAAAMLVCSEKFVRENNLTPDACFEVGASCGVPPEIMGMGPVPSVTKALEKIQMNINQIDLFELNEAFAVQAIAVAKELKIDPAKINVNGGSIALGHPVGASGARIVVSLIHEMKKRNNKHGVAALCIGGGMGEAAVFSLED